MKLFKWMPVSQLVKKKDLNKRRLFEEESSRNSFGMDEDSNMSNLSNASDSQDGLTGQTNTPTQDKEGNHYFFYFTCDIFKFVSVPFSLTY
jgi:hypothetical protein